ncbi:MAG: leucine-rich repeat protein [Acutalibacteraceae bacterium]|nr:leucine-rich repeat protein [Acutalibacteraceae bacterium]
MKKYVLKFVSFILSLVLLAAAVPAIPVEGLTDSVIYSFETLESSESGYAQLRLVDENLNEVSLAGIANKNSADYISSVSAESYVLPEKYDSRNFGFISSVKTQQGSTCWAHAATACLEASYLSQGLTAIENPDFSEMHIAWSYYMQKTDDLTDSTYGDGSNQPAIPLEQGGNEQAAFSVLARWSGAALQADYPQRSTVTATRNYYINNMTDDDRYASAVRLENYIELPNSVYEIKQAIIDNGAVCVSYSSAGTTYPYYYPEGVIDHTIIIVGWDDSYGKENFTDEYRPGRDGAWICKNSWGVRHGDNGYFMMSYDQTPLSKFFCYTADADYYDNNYQYCGSTPSFYSVSGTEPVLSANVFTAEGREVLEAVGVYLPISNTDYKIEIYTGLPSVCTDPVSGGTLSSSVMGTKEHSGYYTVELEEPVILENGERFSVVLTADASWTSSGFVTIGNAYYEHYEAGRGFIYKSGSWRDSARLVSNDVYIRAFTRNASLQNTYKVNFVSCNGENISSAETDINGTVVLPDAPSGWSYRFMLDGAEFSGRGIKGDTEITVHKLNESVMHTQGCIRTSVCDGCNKIFDDVPCHEFDETVIFDWNCKRTEKSCKKCGFYETDFDFPVDSLNGVIGKHAGWYIDTVTGTLYIVGRGEISGSSASAVASSYGWKMYLSSIRNCCVGNEITSLPSAFLSGATFLKSVQINADINEIPSDAFSGCIQLSTVELPESIVRINENSFLNSGLTEIYIPNRAEFIGKQAFFGCSKLETVNGMNGIKRIDERAFMSTALRGFVSLPACIQYLGDGAFSETFNLEGIQIPPECKSYISCGDYVVSADGTEFVYYSSCSDNTVFAIPDGVKNIGAYTFSNNIYLRYIELPDVTSVDVYAFQNTKLVAAGFGSDENITLANSAFRGSVGILSMYLPSNFTSFELYSVGFNASSTVNKAFTLYCESGSPAEKYAKTYGVKYLTDHNEHTFEHISLVEATCLADGVGYELCTVCNQVKDANKVYSVNGKHTYRRVYDIEPDCINSGISHGICIHCGFKGEENTYVPANGHSYEWVKDIAETCDEKGIMHEECSSCGVRRNENTEIAAAGHSFKWVIDLEMTCGDDGIKHEECTVCGFVQSENTPIPSTHQHSTLKKDWYGCRPYGLIRGSKVCVDCGTAVSGDERIVKNTPHVFEYQITVEPTCTRKGEERRICKYCFEVDDVVNELPMAHKYEDKIVKEATCSSYGIQKSICVYCGESLYGSEKTISPNKVHTYDWVTDTEADCLTDGLMHKECIGCGNITSENTVIPAFGHNYVWITDKPESCTENGIRHQQCTSCGDSIYQNTVIPACEHSYIWVVDSEPVCGENGLKHRFCTVCGNISSENTPVPLTGEHSYNWVTDKEPDCYSAGYKHLHCEICNGVSMRNTEIPIIPHSGGETEYSGNGIFAKKCVYCGTVLESEKVSLSFKETDIQIENTAVTYLHAIVNSSAEHTVLYSSSDTKVVTVDSCGKIVASGPGKAVVTATVEGSDIKAQVNVTVIPRKFKVTWYIDGNPCTGDFYEGEKLVMPDTPQSDGMYFAGWTPSVPSHMPSYDLEFTALFKKYDVSKIKLRIIEPSVLTLRYGESVKIYADVSGLPEGATVKWYTEGKGIKITGDKTGRVCTVTCVSTGDAVIHAYATEKGGVPILNLDGKRITDSQHIKGNANPWYIILWFIKKLFSVSK